LIVRHSMDTELSHALSTGLHVAAISLFAWVFLFLLFHPDGLLIGQFKCSESIVKKMYRDINRFAPFVVALSIVIAFTDALDDDLVRNSIGRLAFILLCLLLAVFATGWMAVTRKDKALYHGQCFSLILSPRFWMTLLFL